MLGELANRHSLSISRECIVKFIEGLTGAEMPICLRGDLAVAVALFLSQDETAPIADAIETAAIDYGLGETFVFAIQTDHDFSSRVSDLLLKKFDALVTEAKTRARVSASENAFAASKNRPIQLSSSVFQKEFVVRHPCADDLDRLISLEYACWPSPIAASRKTLSQRVCEHPTDQFVVEIDGEIVAAMYTQPIRDKRLLLRQTAETVHEIRTPKGRLLQLLALNVFPEKQHLGLGDRLLELMLEYKLSLGFERAVAVTRCKNYPEHKDLTPAEYICHRTAQKWLDDPILRFHELHGARILQLVPGYRDKDYDNQGNGVLIEYDLLKRQPPSERLQQTQDFDTVLLEGYVRSILGDRAASFSPQRALLDMGLDSLDLNGLLALLQAHIGPHLDPTFFFSYPTTAAIADFVANGGKPAVAEPDDAAPFPVAPSYHRAETSPDGDGFAVVGMACRFPKGAVHPEGYWHLLKEGLDTIGEVPADRWDADSFFDRDRTKAGKMATKCGSFLDDVKGFDADFFNMAPREAVHTDPQQRILLELAWEALEDASLAPSSLKGSKTGVFVGLFTHDYELLQVKRGSEAQLDTYFATGNSASVAAGRVSYFFGFEGPALAVDTACSSSLVAVHLACRSIRSNECDTALALGVNLILSPELSITFSRSGMLSEDGHCRSFDAAAKGYGRGEGAGGMVIKRLAVAHQNGDRILGIIRGSAINQDGASNGLTAPNRNAQEAVIRLALADAKMSPHAVSYIEAHGTGTPLGDPIEIKALNAVYGPGRPTHAQLIIGSAKTNIGHTEAAAGMAGLIKVMLSMKHGFIPKHLHFQHGNPLIPFAEMPLRVSQDGEIWRPDSGRMIAGVSSFGFSGTNAHIILEEAPPRRQSPAVDRNRRHEILLLSARSEAALRKLASSYAALHDKPASSLAEVCFTAKVGRTHFDHRIAFVADSNEDMNRQLKAAAEENGLGPIRCKSAGSSPHKICFLFTGQGCQFPGMGHALYQSEPVFRRELDRCDALLRETFDLPLLEIIFDKGESLLNDTRYTQPALFALEYALAQLWQSWGITPDVVMGHSVGEYVAACLAGVFSMEDGLKLIAHRGALMAELPLDGGMTAVFAPESVVAQKIAPYSDQVSIAALNGPNLTVISGLKRVVDTIVADLTTIGYRSSVLQVSHAFHSPLMQPMLAAFAEEAAKLTFAKPQIALISNVTGQLAGDEIAQADYWTHHIIAPVRFAPALSQLIATGRNLFLEIGPHPVLSGMGRQIAAGVEINWLASLNKGRADWEQLLLSVGQLYVKGAPLHLNALDKERGIERVSLPTYPFERKPHWIESEPTTNLARIDIGQTLRAMEDSRRFSSEELELAPKLFSYLTERDRDKLVSPDRDEPVFQVTWQRVTLEVPPPPDFLPSPSELADLETCTLEAAGPGQVSGLEKLATDFIHRAFQEMGWTYRVGQTFTTASLAQELDVQGQHLFLFEHLLGLLAESGILAREGKLWRTIGEIDRAEPEALHQRLSENYPELDAELALLKNCGLHLAKVMRGTLDPVQLIFPQADVSLATRLYQESPTFAPMNGQMRRTLSALVAQLPTNRGIRILEIGAGTGGTTAHMLSLLKAEHTTYTFTDLSPLFLDKARDRFKDYPFLEYKTLNVEESPLEQGFQNAGYDIILASNVLHATCDLGATLNHVRQLLAPGGYLLLLEGSAQRRWIDLIFGLLSGWWAFKDEELRPSYPLLSLRSWQALFEEQGFQDSSAFPNDVQGQALFPQAVFAVRNAIETKVTRPNTKWLVFSHEDGVGQRLARSFKERGDDLVLVYPGQGYQRLGDDLFRIDASQGEDFARVLREAVSQTPLTGIIFLWGLAAVQQKANREVRAQDLEAWARLGCGSLVYLIQAMSQVVPSQIARLLLVTEGAQKELGEASGLCQSMLWGVGRAIMSEYPTLACFQLDLDPQERHLAVERIQSECEQLQGANAEHFLAYREGNRFAARLVRATRPPVQESALQFNPDGTYLITGGSGGIASELVPWMIARGASHLVLIGRKPAQGSLLEVMGKGQRLGAQVSYLQADVGNYEQLQDVFLEIATHMPPLRGVIHGAGVMDNGLLAKLDWDSFTRVSAPKMRGAWNLHLLTQDMPLDFFAMFSSVISMIGGSGIANYLAANTFLDNLAHYRRGQGLPGLSLSWGAWHGVGLALADKTMSQLNSQGLESMEAQRALGIFGAWICTDAAHVGVADIKEARFYANQAPALQRTYYKLLNSASSNDAGQIKQDLIQQIREATTARRRELVAAHLTKLVAAVLGFSSAETLDPDAGFFHMGMDSLTSMELRNRLQNSLECAIPETHLLKYPTINEFVDYLCQDLFEMDVVRSSPSASQANQDLKAPFIESSGKPERADAQAADVSTTEAVMWELERLEALLKVLA